MKSIISTFLCFCGSIPLELGISGRGLLDTKNQRLEQTAILLDLLDDDYGTIFDPGNCFITTVYPFQSLIAHCMYNQFQIDQYLVVVKLSKDSQKRIMALIGEVNEFHKTRRRGLRRRKRNHYYNQTYKKIDEGKGLKINSKHI